MLFAGPPGLGKTTLAGIMACEMGAGFRVTSGPALVRSGDVAAILTDLQPGDVLFIDEIHRMGRAVEELLYPAMEDFQLDIVLGRGPDRSFDPARPARVHPRRRDDPDRPRNRAACATGSASSHVSSSTATPNWRRSCTAPAALFGIELTPEGATEIARRSRGTPRLAIRLLRRVRDFVEVRGEGVITEEAAREGLTIFGVDELGLDVLDRRILETLCVRFAGRPVGLSTLAVSVGEEPETVEDVYEPFLLQAGLVMRTPRGRLAAPRRLRAPGPRDPCSAVEPLSEVTEPTPAGSRGVTQDCRSLTNGCLHEGAGIGRLR